MGALCSCLGQRPSSQDDGDLDRILNSEQPTYGTIDYESVPPRDEEELRRERDALAHITARAADHMIDIVRPSQAELNQGLDDPAKHQSSHEDTTSADASHEENEDDEEAAWFEGLEDEEVSIQVPQRGNLVMDVSLLREPPQPKRLAAAH
ncbi:hypothetical protein Slin15195_G006060 [Septoria linicola]|uniref:Uncharacterized protein n=1 Tax=Septoria linicola TaxID=215465 RepID=A0A9Q9AE38_9PEZI|nr:hypothetical protein Slin14017_G006080 [Septoria linicola]USW47287.1 hypothetical protein Slin15195_G006060 [Septoria linicola]